MPKKIRIWLLRLGGVLLALPFHPAKAMEMADDPLLYRVDVQWLEWRPDSEHDRLIWKAQSWLGTDLNKLWFKTEGEQELQGKNEHAELQLLYGRAVAPFWDIQAGWRISHYGEGQSRHWAAAALQGVAPYEIDVEATLFMGEAGFVALRLEFAYDILVVNRLVLTPELEANFYSRNDQENLIGKGLSDVEIGMRMHYRITPEIAPYIGISWQQPVATARRFAREDGSLERGVKWLLGLKVEF